MLWDESKHAQAMINHSPRHRQRQQMKAKKGRDTGIIDSQPAL